VAWSCTLKTKNSVSARWIAAAKILFQAREESLESV
jgi:hypothetical protein